MGRVFKAHYSCARPWWAERLIEKEVIDGEELRRLIAQFASLEANGETAKNGVPGPDEAPASRVP